MAVSGLHFLAADLQIEAVGILYVKAVFGVRLGIESAAFQFGLDSGFVPVVDGVSDVVDARRAGIVIARDEESVAERQDTLLAVIVRKLHAEEVGVEVASFAVVGHLIGNVIDGNRLETSAAGTDSLGA